MRGRNRPRDAIAAGGKAISQKTDVSDNAQVKALVARAVSEFGSLDMAFNNAGLLPPTAPLVEQTEQDWARIMSVDVSGVFFCLKHELAQMAPAGQDVGFLRMGLGLFWQCAHQHDS